MDEVPEVVDPLGGERSPGQEVVLRVVKRSIVAPLPGLEAGNEFPIAFGDATSAFAIVLCVQQVQEAAAPDAGGIHGVEIVGDSRVIVQLYG